MVSRAGHAVCRPCSELLCESAGSLPRTISRFRARRRSHGDRERNETVEPWVKAVLRSVVGIRSPRMRFAFDGGVKAYCRPSRCCAVPRFPRLWLPRTFFLAGLPLSGSCLLISQRNQYKALCICPGAPVFSDRSVNERELHDIVLHMSSFSPVSL